MGAGLCQERDCSMNGPMVKHAGTRSVGTTGIVFLKRLWMVAVLLCLFGQAEAKADPIVYTLSGIASGSLNFVAFLPSQFTITAYADTSQIKSPQPGVLDVLNIS